MNIIEELKSKEVLDYMIVFFIPSSTPLYMFFRGDFGKWLLIPGLPLDVFPSYIVANIIGGIGSFFLYRLGIVEKVKKYLLMRKEQQKHYCFLNHHDSCNQEVIDGCMNCKYWRLKDKMYRT